MQGQDIAPFPEGDTLTRGIYVADGYGIRIHVRRKHLVVADGVGSHRREQRFHKATSGLRRLVVLGHTGYVTFEALRWMTDARAGYLQLDRDGTILATTGALGINKAELRRAQALAARNKVGIELTRSILQVKIEGQANVSTRFSTKAADQIRRRIEDLETAEDLDSLRLVEAQAARVYWELWSDLPVSFVKTHQSKVPDHWKTFGTRGSPYGSRARLAANPANAILNYSYALLEAETTLACSAAGLDPGLGVLHADNRFRASLALDLMEAVRPDVDAYLLDLLEGHVFRAGDFRETRTGVCRINPPLTHNLAQTLDLWYELVAPVIERATGILTSGKDTDTPLTQTNRRVKGAIPSESARPAIVRAHCLECGAPTNPIRKLCDTCLEALRGLPRLERLEALRESGADPAHGGMAGEKRGTSNRRHQLAIAEWNAEKDRPDPELFRCEILPGLQTVSIMRLTEATGLSPGYCSFIRRGMRIPHPRHWDRLRQLVQEL